MKVKAIDGKRAAGARLLAVVVQHVTAEALPLGGWVSEASVGRLMDAEGGVWFTADGGLAVERTLQLSCPCGCWELTTYRDGVEVSREVGSTS